jgi:predicted MPP superfamily phosphohydrolase
MQISDIHIRNQDDNQFIINAFHKARSLRPDFVVYTGDFVNAMDESIAFSELDEILNYGVQGTIGTIAILGNHDYGRNWSQKDTADIISNILSQHEITVLRNESITLAELTFIGFDDYWGPNFMPQEVMKEYDSTAPTVVLCHNPDVCDLNLWNGYKGWILSGHTHGGQIKLPFLPPPILPVRNKRYSAGKIDLDGNRVLYINRGLGYLFPIRFNVRPEITLFELTN